MLIVVSVPTLEFTPQTSIDFKSKFEKAQANPRFIDDSEKGYNNTTAYLLI